MKFYLIKSKNISRKVAKLAKKSNSFNENKTEPKDSLCVLCGFAGDAFWLRLIRVKLQKTVVIF